MIFKMLGLPDEFRHIFHEADFEARFFKRRGQDSYSVSGELTRNENELNGKILAVYALLAEEEPDTAIAALKDVENMLLAHEWMCQTEEVTG